MTINYIYNAVKLDQARDLEELNISFYRANETEKEELHKGFATPRVNESPLMAYFKNALTEQGRLKSVIYVLQTIHCLTKGNWQQRLVLITIYEYVITKLLINNR